MQYLFQPQSIAVIGATDRPDSIGKKILDNLRGSQHAARIYPVNLKRRTLFGMEVFARIEEIPAPIDLAIIAVPAAYVPEVIGECIRAQCKSAIVISAGFRETGTLEGTQLEAEVVAAAKNGHIRLLGPNCMGIMSPHRQFNASMFSRPAKAGSIAFISQSGALCEAILGWGEHQQLGFSHFISIGAMADIHWGDLLLYLGDDPHTKAILLYMESIGHVRSFLSAAREVALNKPIIVIKAGRTDMGAQVAATHTGSITGTDALYDAAFRRTGVLRVETIAELFYMASIVSRQPTPKGNRLAILTNAGGPAVLATDTLMAGKGQLAPLADRTIAQLQTLANPEPLHLSNPVDLGAVSPDTWGKALQALLQDPDTDGVLAIVTPQFQLDPTAVAEAFRQVAQPGRKPLITSIMGGDDAVVAQAKLTAVGIPSFSFPDTATKMFNYLWRYGYNLRGIYETPRLPEQVAAREQVHHEIGQRLEAWRQAGRTVLTELESKEILAAYGLPVVPTLLARSEEEAVRLARQIGFPVVLKVHSDQVIHKARVGGVALNLLSGKSVRRAYQQIKSQITSRVGESAFQGVTVQKMVTSVGLEMIMGSRYDEQFGPVLAFGNGGRVVEIYKDVALGLPPLNTTLARRMMEQTRIYEVGQRISEQADRIVTELEQWNVLFSYLVVEQPLIQQIDINPLAVSSDGIWVLDAAMVLHPLTTGVTSLTPLAIRPYPVNYESEHVTPTGETWFFRPIRPEDEPLVIQFHRTLSDESVYLRYFHSFSYSSRIAHDRLARICFIDYDREIALVALHRPAPDREEELVGIGRIVKLRTENKAEFSVTISDHFHGKGLGKAFMARLIQICRDEGVAELIADILPNNTGMKKVCEKFGFTFRYDPDEQVVKARLVL